MPRDVTTRWNSTFDMLDFAISYRSALDTVTADRDMKLRQFELSEEDWKMAAHLRDALKVWTLNSYKLSFTNELLIQKMFKDATLFFREVRLILPW